jgi:hypothetical protein
MMARPDNLVRAYVAARRPAPPIAEDNAQD